MKIEKEITCNGKILCLQEEISDVPEGTEGYFILDFGRKFEEGDLNRLPVRFVTVTTNQERYQLKKYSVILGEAKNLW